MKPTVLDLRRKKGGRLAMLTAYDFPTARLVAEAGVDLILVGDSLGMVVLGYDSTLPVTLADMVHHTRAARRGAPEAFVIADLPFLSYGTPAQALDSAARLMKEALADSVKLEGGEEVVPIVGGAGARRGAGARPRRPHASDRFRARWLQASGKGRGGRQAHHGRSAWRSSGQAAGAWCSSSFRPRSRSSSPSASASPRSASGPVRIATGRCWYSTTWWGCSRGFTPTFVKRYAEAGAAIKDAVARYAAEVRDGSFPGEGKSFGMKDEVLKRLYGT